MMRARYVTCALLVAACSAPVTPLATARIDTLPGGVIQIHNSGPTLWADTSGWRLVQERVIAPTEGTPGALTNIGPMAVDSRDNLYVMQRDPATIKVYGVDGTWLRDIGRQGNGPGEFRFSMLGIYHDTLFVQDQENNRLSLFTTDGQLIRSVPSQCCINMGKLFINDSGLAAIPGLSPDPAKSSMAWYLTDAHGAVHDTVFELENHGDRSGIWEIELKRGKLGMNIAIPIPAAAALHDAGTSAITRISGNTSRYSFAVRQIRGDTLRLIEATAPTLVMDEADGDSIFAESVTNASPVFRDALVKVARRGDIPKMWPLWSEVDIDGAGRFWVQRRNPSGHGDLFDVFAADGILLGTAPAPAVQILHEGVWTADRVFVATVDAEGLPRIIVFRIDHRGK
ncbi:MAG: hypothetical protein ABIZ70_01535 [Gemmatimonadales bacterium]